MVVKPKLSGGLAIGNLMMRSEALLGTWLWRFPLEQESLWGTVIRSKLGLQPYGWNSNIVMRGVLSLSLEIYFTWVSLFFFFFLSHHTKFIQGNGARIQFWEDI